MAKTTGKKQIVRMCIWVDADLRAEFARAVREKHGGDRGGTGKEASIALKAYLRRSRGASCYRKNNMNKLIDLAMELEATKGYPNMYPRLLNVVVRATVGRDKRTVQKYAKIVQANSIPTRYHMTINWDVSPFVKEAYRCNREEVDPRHIMAKADLRG